VIEGVTKYFFLKEKCRAKGGANEKLRR
jgi:hypothetical protein